MKRTFRFECEGNFIIEIDDALFKVVDDEWRSVFYSFETDEEIAENLAHNICLQRLPLSSLDGWADRKDTEAVCVSEWLGNYSVEEITHENNPEIP